LDPSGQGKVTWKIITELPDGSTHTEWGELFVDESIGPVADAAEEALDLFVDDKLKLPLPKPQPKGGITKWSIGPKGMTTPIGAQGGARFLSRGFAALPVLNAISVGFTAYELTSLYIEHLNPEVGHYWGDLFCDLLDCDPIDPDADNVIDVAFTDQFASLDPNDILGPAGFGADGFIKPGGLLPYTIRFENIASATAPAAEVRITHQLDADLDCASLGG
jgi:hypothetical protein